MVDYPGRRPKLPPLQTAAKSAIKGESSHSAPAPSSVSRSSGIFSSPWRSSSSKLTLPEPLSATISDVDPPARRRAQKLARNRLSRSSKDSAASSIKSDDIPAAAPWNDGHILRGGPIVTTTSTKVLKTRKVEYLVLTSQHLVRFDDAEAAQACMNEERSHLSEAVHHGSGASIKRFEIPLANLVAVFREEGSTPNFGIEVWYTMTVRGIVTRALARWYFGHPKDRDEWIAEISRAARSCSREHKYGDAVLTPDNVRARIVAYVMENEPEVRVSDLDIFPVVRRAKTVVSGTTKGAAEDYSTSSFYLVIGLHLAFLFEFGKTVNGVQPKLLDMTTERFGLVSLARLRATMSCWEERFVVRFRIPFGEEIRLELASRFYRDIIGRFIKADRYLKPAWPQHLQANTFDIKGLSSQLQLPQGEDMGGLKRTLAAYCATYGVDSPLWDTNWRARFAPEFRLMPLDATKKNMWRGQLMAVFRALRYNDYFKSLSFRDVDMTCLWRQRDFETEDSLVDVSRTGIAIDSDHISALKGWSFLSREIHALVFSSGSVRAIDLTNVLQGRNIAEEMDSVEILHPIMYLHREYQCLCESIFVGGNPLSKDDVNELVDTLMTPHVRIKDLDISRCRLQADALEAIWHALGYQGHSLFTLDVSQNMGHVDQGIVSRALEHFTSLRRLGMSNMGVRPGYTTGASLTLDAIWQWPLEELNLSGIALDDIAVQTLCYYLESPASHGLQILYLEKSGLCGNDLARLFRSMGQGREMTVYANGGSDEKRDGEFKGLPDAISNNYGPTALYLDRWDFAHEHNYVRLMRALAHTTTIRLFSATGTLVPSELSAEGGRAIEEFLAQNTSVRYLDLSGYDCKLETSRFGRHFAAAMKGLRHNSTLQHLRVRDQMLGRNVSELATAVAENRTLRTLDMPGSGFRLSEFTFLTKELEKNMSLQRVTLFADDADREAAIVTSCGPAPGAGQSTVRKRGLWPAALTRSTTQDDFEAAKSYKQRRAKLEGEWMANTERILEYIERNQSEANVRMDEEGQCLYADGQNDEVDEPYLSGVFGGLAAELKLDMANQSWRSPDWTADIRPLDMRSLVPEDTEQGNGEAVDSIRGQLWFPSPSQCPFIAPANSIGTLVEETEVPPPIPPMNSHLHSRQVSDSSIDSFWAPQRHQGHNDRSTSPEEAMASSSVVPTPPGLEHVCGDTTGDESSLDDPRTPAEGLLPESERTKLFDLLKHKFWKVSMENLKQAQSVAA